ncbi:hypothetical protein LTR99_009791 [Exophiala xenobiotica]|nr:hypothetical protein LTR99_009791 [Exophiala xenobiotica]
MEGILNNFAGSNAISIPFLIPLDHPSYPPSFHDFPHHFGLHQPGMDAAQFCSLLLLWLFFGLLSEFLQEPVDPTDLKKGHVVDLRSRASQQYFTRWRTRLGRLNKSDRAVMRGNITRTLDLAKEAIQEWEVKAQNSLTMQQISLSVHLLISLLSMVAETAFSTLRWPVSEQLGRICRISLASIRPEKLETDVLRMKRKEAQRYLTFEHRTFLPLPPGVEDGGYGAQLLLNMLVQNGWCPIRARQLCQSCDYLVVNQMLSCKMNSDRSASLHSHLSCYESARCVASNVDLSVRTAYPFRHDCLGGCSFVPDRRDTVMKILENGKLPLVYIDSDAEELDFIIKESTASESYTAISHVWSDGLGNPSGNTLPTCQLRRLRNIILAASKNETALYQAIRSMLSPRGSCLNKMGIQSLLKLSRTKQSRRISFWMDTMCIPTIRTHDPPDVRQKVKALKRKAIKLITLIYAGAAQVVVLDRELETLEHSHRSVSGELLSGKILSSGWFSRGWTLEEGCLAQSCTFWVGGKPYDMRTFAKLPQKIRYLNGDDNPFVRASVVFNQVLRRTLVRELANERRALSQIARGRKSNILYRTISMLLFVRAWNALRDRSTTKAEDGVAIFTNLLDFNVHRLLQAEEKDRLPLLVKSCPELPLSLLYNNGPRLSNPNHPENGWVPLSMQSCNLVPGAIMKTRFGEDKEHYYQIDLSNCDTKSVSLLMESQDSHVQCTRGAFVTGIEGGKYVIDTPTETADGWAVNSVSRVTEGPDIDSLRTAIVIDFTCGNHAVRGYSARGCRFVVRSVKPSEVVLSFDGHVVVYTVRQWQHRFPRSQVDQLKVAGFEQVGRKRKVFLQFEPDVVVPGVPRLNRRRPLTESAWANFTGLLVGLLIGIPLWVWVAVFHEPEPVQTGYRYHSWETLWLFATLFFTIWLMKIAVFNPLRHYIARRAYPRWLKSYEEDWAPPSFGWNMGRSKRAMAGRLRSWFSRPNPSPSDRLREGVTWNGPVASRTDTVSLVEL